MVQERLHGVLMDRHAGTERNGTSLYSLYSSIHSALSAEFTVHSLDPMYRFFVKEARKRYISSFEALDTAIVGRISTLADLRSAGWKGKAILTALGSLPRGGAAVRKVASIMQPQDVVLLSSTADLGIWDWFFTSGPRTEVVPFGIDTDVYHRGDESEVHELRSQLGYTNKNRLILYSGRITLEKNVHSILPLLADLIRDHPNYVLLVAGKFEQVPFHMFNVDVDIEETIKSLAKELNIPERNLRFFPHLREEELVRIYNAADVLINLTLHHDENFGFAQVEAMACGTPVVANAWGGIKDTVVDEYSGYLIPTWVTSTGIRFDRFLARQRLIDILEDDALRHKMSDNAASWACSQYSMGRFSARLVDLVRDSNHGPDNVQFSPAGLRYAWRFSQKREADGITRLDSVPPHYSSYADEDYMRLIRHYTSEAAPEITDVGVLYKPSHWHDVERLQDGCLSVRNSDPLWPHHSAIRGIQADILEFIYQEESTPVGILRERWGQESLGLVAKLVEDGYVNYSSESPCLQKED